MNRLSMRNVRRAFVVTGLATLAVLSGCASTSGASPEQIVAQRAQERWDHLLKLEFSKAYTYLSPAERAVTSEQNYVERFGRGAKWISAKVGSVTCTEADRCSVVIELETQVNARGFRDPIKTTPTEIWVADAGKWWFHKNP
jgi:hypothetical protein